MDYMPTPERIERGLTDKNEWVRLAWIERFDYTPTPEQIERGLAEGHPWFQKAWGKRMEFERMKKLKEEREELAEKMLGDGIE